MLFTFRPTEFAKDGGGALAEVFRHVVGRDIGGGFQMFRGDDFAAAVARSPTSIEPGFSYAIVAPIVIIRCCVEALAAGVGTIAHG